MFDWLKFGLQLLKLANTLSAMWKSWTDKVAGRNEVIIEQKKANDDALTRMDEARARVDADGGAGELHDPDRRD